MLVEITLVGNFFGCLDRLMVLLLVKPMLIGQTNLTQREIGGALGGRVAKRRGRYVGENILELVVKKGARQA